VSAYALTNDYMTDAVHFVRRHSRLVQAVSGRSLSSTGRQNREAPMSVHQPPRHRQLNLRECSVASRPFTTRTRSLALTRPARSRDHALADAVTGRVTAAACKVESTLTVSGG